MQITAEVKPIGREPNPVSSVYSDSLVELLEQLDASVWVTTYQAGKLIILRRDGDKLNTHFRAFPHPMGLSVDHDRLAIGLPQAVQEFRNVPEGEDVRYLPHKTHHTGSVHIHEMAWGHSGPLFVNTAFSCLCIVSEDYSFEPIWQPKFIKELKPGDACHLNGLARSGDYPTVVSAFGSGSEPHSWRENKRDGGMLIETSSQEIVCSGLSMPHSPRWHYGQLWVLESGDGSIGTIDLAEGKYNPVAQFPGFTRGLSFLGPFAFIGLSQVRESAIFSGIPLVDRLPDAEQRACGVWVLNIETGETVGHCEFQSGVEEIFAVEVLPGVPFPDLVNHDPALIGQSHRLPPGVN